MATGWAGSLVVGQASCEGVYGGGGATIGYRLRATMKRGTWDHKSTVANEANEAKDLLRWGNDFSETRFKGSEKVVRLLRVFRSADLMDHMPTVPLLPLSPLRGREIGSSWAAGRWTVKALTR